MDLVKNPLLKSNHEYRLKTIYKKFPGLEVEGIDNILSLSSYFDKAPEKFHSEEAFAGYYKFLSDLADNYPNRFKTLYNRQSSLLDIAFKSLNRINSENIHDVFLPKNEVLTLQFIDKQINYNYQRLIEGVYHAFIYPLAFNIQTSNGKTPDGIDVFNCNEIIGNTEFAFLTSYYNHTIRNGIAHNDIEYREREILYRNRQNTELISTRKLVQLFDNLLDVCNGMAFAYKTFFLANNSFLNDNNVSISKQIIIDELIPNINTRDWQVSDLFESVLPDGRTQLNIYGFNRLIDLEEANFYTFQTAVLCEKFLQSYDRYYVTSNSKYGWPCFSGLNGEVLKENRIKGTQNYKNVYDIFFFKPNFKVPKFVRKLRRMFFSIRTEYKYSSVSKKNKAFEVRWTESHKNKNHCVVKGAITLTERNDFDEDIVRDNLQKMEKELIRMSRRSTSLLKNHRYLPIGFISINIYSQDRRLRNLKNSGLIENLLCTIEVKKLKRIATVDILKSKIEIIGKYRVAWNSKSNVFERI